MDKQSVLLAIQQSLLGKAENYRRMIADLGEGMANETKSSAGDKYETARSMAQMESGQLNGQLAEVMRQIALLQSLGAEKCEAAGPGALVDLGDELFFIGLPAGTIDLGSRKVICISPVSPAALGMRDKTPGDNVTIGARSMRIKKVH
jgi:hypothetical protein